MQSWSISFCSHNSIKTGFLLLYRRRGDDTLKIDPDNLNGDLLTRLVAISADSLPFLLTKPRPFHPYYTYRLNVQTPQTGPPFPKTLQFFVRCSQRKYTELNELQGEMWREPGNERNRDERSKLTIILSLHEHVAHAFGTGIINGPVRKMAAANLRP